MNTRSVGSTRETRPTCIPESSKLSPVNAPITELAAALDELAQAISTNTELARGLPSRFALVLRPSDAVNGEKACSEGFGAPLANVIVNMARDIKTNNSSIADVVNRCELPI